MKKFIIFMAPLGILLVAVGVVVSMHVLKPEPEKTLEPPRPQSLFVVDAKVAPVTLTVTTQGEVRPRTEIDLIPQVSGVIMRVSPAFAEGGIVRPNVPLVEIDDRDYQLIVVRAEARVAEAELQLSRQEASAEIVRKQWEWNKLQKQEPTELGLRKPQVAEARAQYRAALADLENAKLNLARTKITAPFQGRVRSKLVDAGQYVTPGTRLGRVFSTEIAEIRLPLTDEQFAQLDLPIAFNAEAGKGPAVDLSATVGGQMRHWRGFVTRTDAAIDPQTRLYYAIAEVQDPYGTAADNGVPLAMGLFVTAAISGREIANAIVIPRAALRGGNRVYVVTTDNKLAIRDVDVISSNPERAVLRSGVNEGEMVVTAPIKEPREGMEVEPVRQENAALVADDANGGKDGAL